MQPVYHRLMAADRLLRKLPLACMSTDEILMLRCLEMAQRAKGFAAPNPMVGALLVHEGRIIGEGWHRRYGEQHAEVAAIASVAERDFPLIAKSTLYVTLEPCSHHGKQPPCAPQIVAAGIRRVLVCNDDPFSEVSGKGYAYLEQHGVQVVRGVLHEYGRWVNRRFFCHQEQQRPYVILKWAQTKEGFIAPPNKTRTQISGPASQTLVHRWRTEEQALLVGANTVIYDDPQLNARLWLGKQPIRMVIDETLSLPSDRNIWDDSQETWMINRIKDAEHRNIRWVRCDFDTPSFYADLLRQLGAAGIQSVLIEGGANTLQSFLDSEMWDEARVFTGTTCLTDGLKAPTLRYATHFFETCIATDNLDVYCRNGSRFVYQSSLPL